MDFPVTLSAQTLDLFYDLKGPAAFLTPARIRDYAVGAEFVAAFYDGHKGYVWRATLNRRDVPGFPRGALAQIEGSLFPV
jgi:hypothetical protein